MHLPHAAAGTPLRCLVLVAALAGTAASIHAQESWTYRARLGLFGPAHTAEDGLQHSRVVAGTRFGFFRGHSARFAGGSSTTSLDQTPWIATPWGTTHRVGFHDAAHTLADGRRESVIVAMNSCGRAAGYSSRDSGRTAWLASPHGGTRRVGFYDLAHTPAAGAPFSAVVAINATARVLGYSERRDGGRTAWIDPSPWKPPVVIGLFDAEHTSESGVQFTTPTSLSDTGFSTGDSRQYVGATPGSTSWRRTRGGPTVRVGLYSPEYTRSDGTHENFTFAVTDSGWVSGVAYRYGLFGHQGVVAWVANPAGQTVRVGFYDDVHVSEYGGGISVSPDGYSPEHPEINDSGYCVGYSERHGTGSGQTAWMARPDGHTMRIGLYDADHTTAGGGNYSWPYWLTNSGYCLGSSTLYGWGSVLLGQSAWFADVTGKTTRIGRWADPINPIGSHSGDFAEGITESGYIWGSSSLYFPGGDYDTLVASITQRRRLRGSHGVDLPRAHRRADKPGDLAAAFRRTRLFAGACDA